MNRQLAKQYFERAEASLAAGRAEEAMALLNQLDEAFPNTKNIGVARARTYAAMGRVSDAVQLCDELIERHESRRARELKERLVLGVLEPDAAKSVVASTQTPRRRVARIALMSIVVICLIGSIVWSASRLISDSAVVSYVQDVGANPTGSPPIEDPSAAPIRMPTRPADLQKTEKVRVAEIPRRRKPVAAPTPGHVHPPLTWERDAAGIPIWKSGVFKRVPCINEPRRTIDVYLPLAYDKKPSEFFPVVVIQMPRGKPGFIGLEDWAERSEAILIAINTSRNGKYAENPIAQDRALETVSTTMRVDQRMGFAIGMSGGGRTSWQMVCRYPEYFRGLVMIAITGDYEICMIPLHVRVAHIHGDTDFNNDWIARSQRLLLQNGYQVREKIFRGGHQTGPLPLRVEMLNWMVYAARLDLGLPQPSR